MAVKSMYAIAVIFILIGLLIVFIISCCTKAARGVTAAGVFLLLAGKASAILYTGKVLGKKMGKLTTGKYIVDS